MEKIKDALAKTKLENKSAGATALVNTKNSRLGSLRIDADLNNIAYTNTTVIKLDSSHLEKNRVVSLLDNDVNSSIFDSLRTQVLQKMEENNWKTLAVVSPSPESGKTLVSINLAISIAHQPQKTVALVDFDLRRPKVAAYLGIHTSKSINEFLQGDATIDEVMVNPSIPRMIIMPTMRPVPRSADILSSNKVKNLIKELKERYDSRIIIFDLPPILSSDDAMVLLPQVDCILLVVADGMSTQEEIEQTLEYLPKGNLLGVVLNKAELEHKPYYY